jgi:tripartite-type tricarboxylate transporter receptor subunit TctC
MPVRSLIRRLTLPTLACSLLVAGGASAQSFPSKTITMILPFAAAGSPDVLARSISDSITQRTGKTVVVEPRPGGAGAVAMGALARAEPDGHTIGMTYGGALIVSPLTVKGTPYDTFKDFTPVALLTVAGNIVVSSTKWKTLPEVIKYAKANPGKVSVGYVGLGTRINILVMSSKLGVKFLEVPYQQTAPQIAALISGELDVSVDSPGTMAPLVKEGRIKALAMGGPVRDPQYPDTPLIREALPGNDATYWFGVVAPAGVPKDRIQWLNSEINKSLAETPVKARLYVAGYPLAPETPEGFAKLIKTQYDDYARIVKEYNISQ